jgi:peptidoglycan/LPS O-acetylase OafA/YrhL
MKVAPVQQSNGVAKKAPVDTGARLESLTGLRWFATVGVFLSHVNVLLPLPHTRGLFSMGESGVSLFFILSGFVLAWTFKPSDTPVAFYGRRFARVWPLLFVAIAIPTFFALTSKTPQPAEHLLLISLSAILLIQAWVPGWILMGASPVTWSLSCEALFYTVVPLAVRKLFARTNKQLIFIVCAAMTEIWVIRITLWLQYPAHRHVTSMNGYSLAIFGIYAPFSRMPQFMIGMVTAIAIRRGWKAVSVRTAFLLMLVPMFVLWMLRGDAFRTQVLFDAVDQTMTPFYALLIAALARRDLMGRPSFLRTKPMVQLGQWSYAFYLFQFTVLLPVALVVYPGKQIADFFTNPVSPSYSHIGYAFIGLLITLGISILAYRYIEHPLERRLRRRFLAAAARRAATRSVAHPNTEMPQSAEARLGADQLSITGRDARTYEA